MKTLQLVFTFCFVMGLCSPAMAHKIRIFAWEEGGKIVTESKFSSGRAARGAEVTAKAGQEVVARGLTDDNGIYSFPLPDNHQQLDITVNSGDGHKGSWLYLAEPAESAATTSSPPPPVQEQASTAQSDKVNFPQCDDNQIASIVEKTVDRQLAPIRRQLAEATDSGPKIQDILGGLGYILGLAGIAAYVRSRKN